MDIAQKSYPMVNYILSRMPSFSSPTSRSPSSKSDFDIEQPSHTTSSPKEPDFVDPLLEQMPHLKDPKVVAEMAVVVGEISQTRSVLRALGRRPDHESVDKAKEKVAEIEASLTDQLDDIALSSPRPTRPGQNDRREAAEKEKAMYKAVIDLDDMHRQYEKQLRDAEQRLMKIYNSAAAAKAEEGDYDKGKKKTVVEAGFELLEAESSSARELVDEEVVRILENDAAGKRIERVNLSERMLKILPEAFGRLKGVVALDLSNNHLESIPDSIAGLKSLEEFNLSSNLLESLPDSIGLLLNLKVLNVSGNKLSMLPDSICHCKSLVELDASYNGLTYLPTYLGNEMVNLRRLSVPYNKLNSLPTSIGQMKSLQHLEVHFNALRGLPRSIGNITNLETLNLSGNFSDLFELPATFGELINLKELDLSNNQIHALPDTFGRLDNLVKLNLDYNPITVPPPDVVRLGVQAVKLYMSQRWLKLLEEEEERNMRKEETESGWLDRSTTWMKRQVSTVSEYLGSPKSPRDAYLNEQL